MDTLVFIATPLLGFFAITFLYYLVCRKNINKPAEPAGAWPIIGHLHLLTRGDLPHKTLGAMADKYGPFFMVRLGLKRAIVVSSWEIAKECFTTNDRFLANRPVGIALEVMGFNNAMFGFTRYGPYWRDLRKIVMLELLSSRRLDSLKHVWDSEISTSIKELYQLWANQNNDQLVPKFPVLVEMKQWFSDLTLNVALRMVAGKRYFGASANYSDQAESRRCQRAMRDFFRLIGMFVIGDALPFLRWLDLDGHEKEMKRTGREIDSLLQGWLDEHKKKKHSGEKRDQDFMYVLLSIIEDSKITDYDVDTIVKANCFTLILGASDTTMVTLTWALSLLLNNPHVLEKVQDELDFHVGKDRQVDESDIKNLPYLKAVIKETLRLYPAGPLLAPREVIENCIIGGYHVSAGTRVMVNAYKLQRDPLIWLNPNDFQPERFLNNDVDLKGRHFEFIPFGSGRRVCPAISFVLELLPMALARLLHGFELVTQSNSCVDMTESAGLVNAKATPLEVLVWPRLLPKFYV